MRPDLQLTSVPAWATAVRVSNADLSGRFWTVVGFGAEAQEVVTAWANQIHERHPKAAIAVHRVGTAAQDDVAAAVAVSEDLADALVGWRLMIAGPADACLRLRAHALRCGVADDEIVVGSTAVATREVLCAHCGTRSRADVDLEEVMPCTGCGRNLLVYYHVSRLKGAHLGFMVDAEQVEGADGLVGAP
jgi:dimethylamine monooxygenase subunit C